VENYTPHLFRAAKQLLIFVLFALMAMVFAHFFPEFLLLIAIVLSIFFVWCTGNIISMMVLVYRRVQVCR